jgi:glutamate---cysteine ligase / carboxylate-amine ligase
VRIYEDVGKIFAAGRDLTIGIEEEFQILDESTLALTPRFDDLKAAADARFGGVLVVSELIQSEAEINSRVCESISEARDDMLVRRAVLMAAAESQGLKLCATGVHPFSRWEEQEFIDTPHYRKVVEKLQYVAWTNNTFGLHVHVGVRGPDRAIAVCDALRSYLPELLALSASSPFFWGRESGLHSTRAQVFMRSFPRCGIPDIYHDWATYAAYAEFLYDTGSVTEPTQFWWTVRPHHTYGTIEVRIADAQPRFEESMALAGLTVALIARLLERLDREGGLPTHESRFIEENRWRALRYGLAGNLIDLDERREVPATEMVRRLAAEVADCATRLGIEPELAQVERMVAEGNSAQRQLEEWRGGAGLLDIHRRMVEETMRPGSIAAGGPAA